MFNAILSALRPSKSNDLEKTRRRYERRVSDQCVSMIDGNLYPIIDWSFGGVQIAADARKFALNQEMDVILKFYTGNNVVEIPHKARIVRKNINSIACQFLPLTKQIHERFRSIVDDAVAREFVDSQLV
jgi:hypothetical protein